MLIFAIESSCDETSSAIIRADDSGMKILSNKIASQIDIHRLYGGVVPEIASRAHTEAISRLSYAAFEEAEIGLHDIDAIAVTNRPGLIGALLVGVNFAKSAAFACGKQIIAVDHIQGHIAANYLVHDRLRPPFLALVVSGGHTSLIDVRGFCEMTTIGRTRDDAAGEAFDKVARVMGLPYPGGAEMDRLAYLGDKNALHLPSAAIAGDTLDFSFSGLKTHIINYINTCSQRGECYKKEDVAAAFTADVTDSIVKRIGAAQRLTGYTDIVIAGGVAANSHLRTALGEYTASRGLNLYMPPLSLCGDNAAMIAAQGYYEFLSGHTSDETLNAFAVL
jgi:N6-L-threonylcarbamoyladenine synthase